MALFNWFSSRLDASTISACREDLARVRSHFRNSAEFTLVFKQAIEDFDVKRVTSPANLSLNQKRSKAAALLIKRKAGPISMGQKTIEEAVGMVGNWLLLTALSQHSDPRIALEAYNLATEYQSFAKDCLANRERGSIEELLV